MELCELEINFEWASRRKKYRELKSPYIRKFYPKNLSKNLVYFVLFFKIIGFFNGGRVRENVTKSGKNWVSIFCLCFEVENE